LLGAEEEWSEVLALLLEEVIRIVGINRIERFTLPFGVETYLPQKLAQRFRVSPWATYRIDLTKSVDDLWSGLKSSARKSIKRAQNDGIVIETLDGEKGRREFHPFRQACLEERGTRSFSVEMMLIRYRWLKKINGEEIWVAKNRDVMIGGLGIWQFNGILYEFGSYQSRYSYEQKLYGGDLIKWEIIQRAQAEKVRCYDLSGVNPNPEKEKEKGIARFKKKWGGVYGEYPVFSGRWENRSHIIRKVARAKRATDCHWYATPG